MSLMSNKNRARNILFADFNENIILKQFFIHTIKVVALVF